jgi:hypothetical protein
MNRDQVSLMLCLLLALAALADFLIDRLRHRPDPIVLVMAGILALFAYASWRRGRGP